MGEIADDYEDERRSVTRLTKTLTAVAVAAAVVAVLVLAPTATGQDDAYGDVSDDAYYHTPLQELATSGVLEGTDCEPAFFCPHDSTDRATMAVWIIRALNATPADDAPLEFRYTGELSETRPGTHRFGDVNSEHWAAPYIYELARMGITVGCSAEPTLFCPDDTMTRAQMASFLRRAFDPPEAQPAGFLDVTTSSVHHDSINRLFATGITVGCSQEPLLFCPHDATTRAHAATFLHRALAWTERNDPEDVNDDPDVDDPDVDDPDVDDPDVDVTRRNRR